MMFRESEAHKERRFADAARAKESTEQYSRSLLEDTKFLIETRLQAEEARIAEIDRKRKQMDNIEALLERIAAKLEA